MNLALQQEQVDIVTRHFVVDPPAIEDIPAQQNADEAIAGLIEDFDLLEDWTERYQYIIDQGKKLAPLPATWQTTDHLLHGCQSQVWLVSYLVDDRLYVSAQSDSTIVNGLIALLKRVYNGRPPQEILSVGYDFLAQLGLNDHLSPTRRNGLYAMVQAIRTIAGQVAHG